jgi:hypothetical protein
VKIEFSEDWVKVLPEPGAGVDDVVPGRAAHSAPGPSRLVARQRILFVGILWNNNELKRNWLPYQPVLRIHEILLLI